MSSHRPEVRAFVAGFALAWQGYEQADPLDRSVVAANGKTVGENINELFKDVFAFAVELYGEPYDDPPEPAKASRKGMKEPWEQGYFEEQQIPKAVGDKQ